MLKISKILLLIFLLSILAYILNPQPLSEFMDRINHPKGRCLILLVPGDFEYTGEEKIVLGDRMITINGQIYSDKETAKKSCNGYPIKVVKPQRIEKGKIYIQAVDATLYSKIKLAYESCIDSKETTANCLIIDSTKFETLPSLKPVDIVYENSEKTIRFSPENVLYFPSVESAKQSCKKPYAIVKAEKAEENKFYIRSDIVPKTVAIVFKQPTSVCLIIDGRGKNLLVSLKSLDIYLNGKLISKDVLPRYSFDLSNAINQCKNPIVVSSFKKEGSKLFLYSNNLKNLNVKDILIVVNKPRNQQ